MALVLRVKEGTLFCAYFFRLLIMFLRDVQYQIVGQYPTALAESWDISYELFEHSVQLRTSGM
jgi:hypothetical protein